MKQQKRVALTLFTSLRLVLIIVLGTFEIIVGAQYGSLPYPKDKTVQAVTLTILFIVVVVLSALNIFVFKTFKPKLACFIVSGVCLSVAGGVTGNEYLSVVWSIALTELYIDGKNLKNNLILGSVCFAVWLATYVWGWVVLHKGTSDYATTMAILSGVFVSLLIFATHFLVTNFVTRYYRINGQLREALNEARASREQLTRAYEKLAETAVYEERNRIAKDIHDTAGHSMTAIIMQTEAAKLIIDNNPEEAKKRIISANMQAKTALEQMRESVHLLAGRTSNKSVKQLIEEIVAQTMDGTDVKILCDVDDVTLPTEAERAVCNGVKECLVNGIRHGGATAFYVELKQEADGVRLLVSDNGSGVEGEVKEGFGLTGMRHTVEALNGTMDIKNEKDEGFEVSISLPLKPKEN